MQPTMKKLVCMILVCVMAIGLFPVISAAGSIDRFNDVPNYTWYTKSVQYVYENGLMNGVSDKLFAPAEPSTRAMVITVLHRMAGCPAADSEGFTDVPENAWFTDAVLWGQANGIIEGYGDGTFRPNSPVTREQMIALFYRYALYKNYDTSVTADLTSFVDYADILDYAQESMSWSVAVGLVEGFPDGTVRPQAQTTRAQMATILMRYADINQIPDDGNDDEDTGISEDDKTILSASTYEILAQSTTSVNFYVNSTLTVPYFELYEDGVSTGIRMYDNGNYSGCGDDIPNDGCYTAVVSLNPSKEQDYTFTAITTVSDTAVKSNDIEIFAYCELTDSELDEMDLIDTQIQLIIEQTLTDNLNADTDTLINLLRENILAYLYEQEDEGRVYGIIDDPENYLITFKLASGLSDGIQYYDPHSYNVPIEEGQFSNQTSAAADPVRSNVVDTAITPNVTIDVDYITYKERALLLCYEAFSNGWNGGRLEDTTANLNTSLTAVGFDVDARYSVTVDDFMNMQEYDYIHISCHGSQYTLWTSPFTNEKTPVICTPQSATREAKKAYSSDIKKDRIVVVGGHFWIRPSFFDYHYEEEALKANLVSLGCCKGAITDHLADAIVNAGAETVIAYSDIVYTAYDYSMSAKVLDNLYDGRTVSQALDAAKNVYGDDDLVWGAAQRDSGNTAFNTLKPERARPRLFGDSAQKLHNSLYNGTFDNTFDITFGFLLGWKKYGDARSIFRLAGIEAQSSPRMAIISSGFGSMGSETTSSIYQTFLVPGDATSIEFCYDVVSEEPMEYVGTQFNDIFQVDLLNTDGVVLETLAYESVNTSTWYPIDGIDFPDGDDTTYHTRWNKVTSDVLSKYRGQLIVIRFVVQDAGDSIYDTAVLIDSVKVN